MVLAHMTGVGRYLLGLCKGLNTLPGDERIELWLQMGLQPDHPVWELAGKRLSLRTLPARPLSLRSQWVLPAALRDAHPDLLHYPHFDLPWLSPGRLVATLYDLKYIARPDFFPHAGRIRRWLILAMTRHTVRRAKRIIVPSVSTANDLRRRLGASIEKICVIPLGIDERFFESATPQEINHARRRYGLEQPFVLCVGERRPHKNLCGLLRAFQIFRRSAPNDYHLAIVGESYPGYSKPEELTETLGLKTRVHFLDHVAENDLKLLYHATDATVLISHYEGFGLPVLEAMACKSPVVISNVTSLPEVAGNAGLQVPPDAPEQAADALLRVIPGGDLRQECINLGIRQAQRFTWTSCARQTMKVYQEALTE